MNRKNDKKPENGIEMSCKYMKMTKKPENGIEMSCKYMVKVCS